MKTFIKASLAFLFFAAITTSCSKESMNTAATKQSTNQSASQADDGVQTLHHVGEMFGGGIIFYLDSTKLHGLIAAPSDMTVNGSTQIPWYNGSYVVTGAKGAAIGAGLKNTNKIVNVQGSGTYAAKLCADLVLNGFSDWFLPSKKELNALYNHRAKVPGLNATNYWSSTESDANNAWDQVFDGGFKFADDKRFTIRVRAVRSF